MNNKTMLVAVIAMVCVAPSANADLLCIKKSQKINGGKVNLASVLQTTTSTCPAGYVPVLDTNLFQGPSGPQGPKGPKGDPGLLKVGKCRTKIGTATLTGATDVKAVRTQCNENEFLLTHGGNSNDLDVDLMWIDLLYFSGEDFPVGVEYTFGRNTPSFTNTVVVAVSAVCCPR